MTTNVSDEGKNKHFFTAGSNEHWGGGGFRGIVIKAF